MSIFGSIIVLPLSAFDAALLVISLQTRNLSTYTYQWTPVRTVNAFAVSEAGHTPEFKSLLPPD